MKDFYDILGIDIDSSLDQIREAYRKLSKKFHPDLNQGDAYFDGRFREINEAYETLSDPGTRKKYDTALRAARGNPIDNEFERRQSNRRQEANGTAHAARPVSRRYRRGPSVGTSIVLVVLGLIFAVYLFKSFSTSKIKAVKSTVAATPAYKIIHKHHKRKYIAKNTVKNDSDSVKPADAVIIRQHQPHVAPVEIKTLATGQNEALIASNKPDVKPDSYLYSTYVRPNITGIVNLRATGEYGSVVIATIPAETKVYVMERAMGYYKISYNNIIGYVPKWALEKK